MKKLSALLLLILTSNSFAAPSKDVVDMSLVDQTINPCEDFFQYACGNWLKNNPIPGDKSELYRFSDIDENTLLILKNILQNYQTGTNSPAQVDSKKLGDAYSACLNTSANEASSKNELKKILSRIHLLQHKEDLMPLLASLHRQGITPFFGMYSVQNPGGATHMIGVADQSGLGLPEKGYYFDDENQKVREQYLAHIQKTLALFGVRDAEKIAKDAYAFELKLAKFSLSAQDQQDPVKTYNPIGKKALQKLTPDMDWSQYFSAIHIDSADRLDVVSPVYFQSLSALIKKTALSDLKSYMTWYALKETARFSTAALQQEHFNFYNKTLNGTKERQPQWKTCISTVDNSLGEALGEAFIKVAFGQESKDLADQMVLNVKTSLKELVTKLDWMDDETKEGAFKKIAKLNQKIGFPKKFKSYSDLTVTKDSWFKNQIAANAYSFDDTIKKANLPVDRDVWGMTPPTDNAYYDPTMNEIVFPAGILQAPLFNVKSSVAANYGATGATMGHEMTHGFDDSGSQYDELGNLKNWWTEESAKIFKEKGQCLIDQYNAYTLDDGTHLDGQLSLTENTADLGGLKIALAAFMKTHANIENSEFKTFFIAYAQSWCGKYTDEAAHTAINTDVHSLPKFRVNGVVSDLPEFEEVFQCKSGEPMAPKNRCSIW